MVGRDYVKDKTESRTYLAEHSAERPDLERKKKNMYSESIVYIL